MPGCAVCRALEKESASYWKNQAQLSLAQAEEINKSFTEALQLARELQDDNLALAKELRELKDLIAKMTVNKGDKR